MKTIGWWYRCLSVFVSLTFVPIGFCAAPVISSFTPASDVAGSAVTINGSNLGATPAANIVYFGAVRAAVTSASTSNLTVTLPAGATYAPITETVDGLTADSSAPFLPTFTGSSPLSSSSLNNMFNLALDNGPFGVAIGDLDGDGKPDLVVVNDYSSQIWIYRNIGTNGDLSAASFAPPVILDAGSPIAAENIEMVVLADLDGDGRLDIVFENHNNSVVSVFQNLCSPGNIAANTFGPRLDFAVGSQPFSVAVADLDGDGRPDLITGNYGDSTISVLRNVSTGGLLTTSSFASPLSFATPSAPACVVAGDVDGDGKNDLITANTGGGSTGVSIFDNTSTVGHISFAPRVDLADNQSQDESVAIGDIDGDGKQDLVIGSYTDSSFSVYRNIGTPGNITGNSFAAPVTFAAGGPIHQGGIALADLDGDGKPDVAAVDQNSGLLYLYRNVSTPGSFTSSSLAAPVTFTAGFNSATVAIGDLDADGRPDIVIANSYGHNLTLYKNINALSGAPVISAEPTNETVVVGGATSFSVVAIGSSPLSYQWYNGSGSIAAATNSTLTLNDVQSTDAGSYYVTVSNPYGSTNSVDATLTVTSPSSSCTPPPSGIVSWWRAEDNANDSVGGNNGTLLGSVTYAAGEVGQAFMFNTTNDGVRIPASASLNVGASDGFTVEAWVNPENVAVRNPIFEWNSANATQYWGAQLYIDPATASGPQPGTLMANIQDINDGWHILRSAGGTITNNVFQHVALTYDKTSGLATIYYNGSVVARQNMGVFTPKTAPDLYLGRRPVCLGSPTYSFGGEIDEAAVYNRALSQSEIQAIYNAGNGGKCAIGVAPMIAGQPTNQTVVVGGTATFAVGASGSPTLSYQWYNGSGSIAGGTNSILILSNVQLSDAGSYYVTVSNPYGSTNSTSATLTVTNPPPVCTPAPSDMVAWWQAEGNALDAVGGNNGIVTGAVSYASGEVGQAFHFTDTNEDIVIPASSNLNVGLGAGLTLEAWVNPDNVSNYNPVFEWNPGDGSNYWGVGMFVLSGSVYNSTPVPGTLYANVQGVGDVWHQLWSAPGTVTNGGFQHVALTYDKASGVAKLYYNGTVVAQKTFGSFTPKTIANLHIGRRPTDPAGERDTFLGLIDEAAVYSRALSQSEIQAIYNAGGAGKCFVPVAPTITGQPTNETVAVGGSASFAATATGSPMLTYQWYNGSGSIIGATNATLTLSDVQSSDAGTYYVTVSNPYGSTNSSNATLTVTNPPASSCMPPPSGIVSWWRAEGNANDSVGGNNGTLLGSVTYGPGEVGQAFMFNTTNDGVKIPASASLDVGAGNGFTLEAWVNPENVAVRNPIFEWNPASASQYWGPHFYIDPATAGGLQPGTLLANIQDVNDNWHIIRSAGGVITSNVFQHVALTYDKTSGLATIYYNGSIVAQQNLGVFRPKTGPDLYLGRRPISLGSPTYSFGGEIDEPAVYNRVLSQGEIQGIYNAGGVGKCTNGLTINPPSCTPAPAGITGWWRAESNALDSVGGNNGTLMNGAGFEPGEVNTAFALNGTSSYVLVQSINNNLDIGSLSGMTIEGWINPNTVNQQQLLCEWERVLGTFNGSDVGVDFAIQASTQLYANFTDTSGNSHEIYSPANLLSPNVWQHVAMTYDTNSGVGALYINGSLVVATNVGTFVPQTSYTNFLIGGRTTFGSVSSPVTLFGGGMDEWSVYNRALSQSEIAAVYNAGSAGKCTNSINHPPVADASATVSPVISPNGTNAAVLLDGSLSSDPDGDSLQYEWIANGAPVGSGVTLQTILPVGTNQISLIVNDGMTLNQQTIAVQVITESEAIQELSILVTTDFTKAQSMAALLGNAIKSVDKSNPAAAINQLQAFQNQVNAQIAPLDPVLAQLLVQDAQNIIDTLSGSTSTGSNVLKNSAVVGNGSGSLFLRHANGHAYIGFSGVHQKSYSVQVSSDLAHWTNVGPALEVLTGSFEFEDISSTNVPVRYYRIVTP